MKLRSNAAKLAATVVSLATWHGDRGMRIWAAMRHEKNNTRLADLKRDYIRHMHFFDLYTRRAFLLSHMTQTQAAAA